MDRMRRGSSGWLPLMGGAMAMLVASRVLPPVMGQLLGARRDPFQALAADHRRVLGMLDRLCDSRDDQVALRTTLFLAIKRALGAHALAEEDVVYPALKLEVGEDAAVRQLYEEHAEIKLHLHRLETMPKREPQFAEVARALRDLIRHHAHQEEAEEFPKLRRALDESATAKLAGGVAREKAMLL